MTTILEYNKKQLNSGLLKTEHVAFLVNIAKSAGETASGQFTLIETGAKILQKKTNLTVDGKVGPQTISEIEKELLNDSNDDVKVLDLTSIQRNPPLPVRGKMKWKTYKGKVVERKPKNVIGIVIHQTACVFGPHDDADARHKRALNVACHALAFRDGTVVLANPLQWYVWHGNGFNAYSLGLEVEGHYSGLADNEDTPRREDIATTWGSKEPTPLTELTIETAKRAVKELVERGKAMGMPIEYIWAHRQSSDTRRSDPGELLWKSVVLDYAVPVLGLKTEVNRTEGDGYQIPNQWDPTATAKY